METRLLEPALGCLDRPPSTIQCARGGIVGFPCALQPLQ